MKMQKCNKCGFHITPGCGCGCGPEGGHRETLAAKDRQIAELTAKLAVEEKQLDGLLKNAGSIACAIAGYETDLAVRPLREQLTAATARAERAEKAVEACKPLIDACREEFMGDEGLCDHEPDNEPVMAGLDKKSPITFGMVRAALAAAGTRGEGENRDT